MATHRVLRKTAEGTARPRRDPWPGELGKRIYDNVSAQAWKMWEDRMKMILNEYRLMPWQKEAQAAHGEADGGFLLRRERCAAAGIQARMTVGGPTPPSGISYTRSFTLPLTTTQLCVGILVPS